jgi:hypothetical protein
LPLVCSARRAKANVNWFSNITNTTDAAIAATVTSMTGFYAEGTSIMLRIRKFVPVVALLACATIFGAPTQANASYTVSVYDDGVLQSGIGVLVSGSSLVFTGSTTHFSITNGSGTSNNPGTQGGSNLALSSNEQISTQFGAAGGSHTITIVVSQNGWTAPGGTSLVLSSSAGGSFDYLTGTLTYLTGTPTTANTQSVSATYQGFLDNTNTIYPGGAALTTPGGASTPIQTTGTVSRTSPGTSSLVFTPGTSINPSVPGGTPFTLTDVLSFTFTVGPGSGQTTANVSASTTVTSVPAPAGLVLALTSVPVLGIGAWLRRRRPK